MIVIDRQERGGTPCNGGPNCIGTQATVVWVKVIRTLP